TTRLIWEAPAVETKPVARNKGRMRRGRRMHPASSVRARSEERSLVRVLLAQFSGEQAERVEPPGEVEVGREHEDRVLRPREIAGKEGELVESRRELRAALVGVELDGEGLDGAV